MFRVIKDISNYLLKHPTDRYNNRNTDTIDTIVVHQTDTLDQGAFTPYDIANYHVNNNGWAGIGYHFMITDEVKIYQTNPTTSISYHASDYNTRSIGVAITGNHTTGSTSSNADIIGKKKYNALIYLLAKLSLEYNVKTKNIIGHTETGSPKSCPNLIMPQLRDDVAKKKGSNNIIKSWDFSVISGLVSLFNQKVVEIKEYKNYKNYLKN